MTAEAQADATSQRGKKDRVSLSCLRHPKTSAAWLCRKCGSYLCETCPSIKEVRGVTMETCPVCGASLRLVRLRDQELRPDLFDRLFKESARYPLSAGGITVLACSLPMAAVGFFTRDIMLADSFVHFVILLYLIAYGSKVLQASILGDTSIPDWPDALAPYEAIWLPAGYLIIASIFAFSPGLILWIWADVESPIPFAIAYALSCALWPISLLGMTLFEDLAALKPQFLWLSIRRIRVGYIRTAVACAVIIGLVVALLSQFHHCGLLFMMLAFPTCLYLLMVSLRMIGVLYYANRTALGWFSEEL